jgi:3-isopropylmalate dehydrogenase
LSAEAIDFCRSIFSAGGAVLSGPGGGRYVYDLRREFDLFCKFVPIQPFPELADAGCLRTRHVEGLDVLLIRDNTGGVYQGRWTTRTETNELVAEHVFHYRESHVRRIVEVAARAAAARRGRLHVVVKDSGVPAISDLWRDVSESIAHEAGVEWSMVNVDLAAYQLVQTPDLFDVIVTPNLIGDILADIAGVLVASRGVTFSGNFTAAGHAVYQTNHGCAHDLAEKDIANPGGQILSLAMLLRESFGLEEVATRIERALASAWRAGHRTADVARPGDVVLGTRAMADHVVEALRSVNELARVA